MGYGADVRMGRSISTTAPSIAAGAAAVSVALDSGSDDYAGSVAVTFPAVAGAGILVTFTFSNAFGNPPRAIFLQPQGTANAMVVSPTSISNTGWTLYCSAANSAANNATIHISYLVIGQIT